MCATNNKIIPKTPAKRANNAYQVRCFMLWKKDRVLLMSDSAFAVAVVLTWRRLVRLGSVSMPRKILKKPKNSSGNTIPFATDKRRPTILKKKAIEMKRNPTPRHNVCILCS